ncbi:uncharacterized protein LOC129778455 [Toxorhynchites rutilus septentrionalis]|uniref:uncharacterized protein LOC129778455 n=1 Tax=Toxorhynchites rutilus septentrionalis TaxID=329112 RepID=UPI002478D997|nr:uncharacterized protein LOC129778455 [Toxorhynchites rutilus septentrionalis]
MASLKALILFLIGVTGSQAGICQDVFKNPNVTGPFFKVSEPQGIEVYFPKRDVKQEMFGIKIYKNQDLRRKNISCDLCVNTTNVEDGCFKIKSTTLAVKTGDVLKYVMLGKLSESPTILVSNAQSTEFTDYVIPANCNCRESSGGYCSKASSKITDYRPLFVFHESTGFAVYLPKAMSTAVAGMQALKNANFRRGDKQTFDLDIESFAERKGCFVYEATAPMLRFGLGDHLNFIVTGKKTGGEKIRTDPRKVFVHDYFIPVGCTCPSEPLKTVKAKPINLI